MKKQFCILVLFILLFPLRTFSQSFLISAPVVSFNEGVLQIDYDIISKNKSDQFFVWVEIVRQNGEPISAKSLTGDIGEKVSSGTGKKIFWIPEKDSVLIDELITVEVKAEMYSKAFNKGTAMLMSAALPGLGQTKISNGKPYWLVGVAAYGAIAGGLIVYNQAQSTYDSYKTEDNITEREDLYNNAQKKMDLSQALIISGAAVWAANIIWVALIPNKTRPMRHMNISYQSTGPNKGTTFLTLRYNF